MRSTEQKNANWTFKIGEIEKLRNVNGQIKPNISELKNFTQMHKIDIKLTSITRNSKNTELKELRI